MATQGSVTVVKKSLPTADVVDFVNQNVSYHTSIEDALSSDKLVRYVVGSDGVYLVRKNNVGTFIAKTDKVAGGCQLVSQVRLETPKVPYELLCDIMAFFKEVYRQRKSEAAAQIFWDEENREYFVHIPKQEVSGGSCKYFNDEQLIDNYPLVIDIHSHGNMGAFFSNTDDKDDKDLRIYGVVGKLDSAAPEYKFRFGYGDGTKEINVRDVFEMPFEEGSFPDEWLDQLQEPPKSAYIANAQGQLLNIGKVISDYDKELAKKPRKISLVDDDFMTPYGYSAYSSYKVDDTDKLIEQCVRDLDSNEVATLVTELMKIGHSDIIEDCVVAFAYGEEVTSSAKS